jgi:hypothetical protein
MSGKKLNKVETFAANVLAGYMRSKIDANALQPAIFSDLYGKKINAPYKAATTKQSIYPAEKVRQDTGLRRIADRNKKLRQAAKTIQGAVRNKQARNEMAKMKDLKVGRLPPLKESVSETDYSNFPEGKAGNPFYDNLSDAQLAELAKTLPETSTSKMTRRQKDIYNAVQRRSYKRNKNKPYSS